MWDPPVILLEAEASLTNPIEPETEATRSLPITAAHGKTVESTDCAPPTATIWTLALALATTGSQPPSALTADASKDSVRHILTIVTLSTPTVAPRALPLMMVTASLHPLSTTSSPPPTSHVGLVVVTALWFVSQHGEDDPNLDAVTSSVYLAKSASTIKGIRLVTVYLEVTCRIQDFGKD
ncbi:hypothetical protein [Oryza sativa Japonica Group]|uniref:Uncharacterized protein n=2 Tax=Oryza sativa subsp. japonica TaxID=39947 RepID=Q5N9H6_ORYSJ|nr:hypothetical protein [Oryza sativa Japonica Group]BAD82222.1 hypothetical protein [Oryza sativa Japonica Group]